MLLNLLEVHEDVVHHNKAEGKKQFTIRNVVVNKRFVTYMREDASMQNYLSEGLLPESLDRQQKFTRISIAIGNIGKDIIVVGDLQQVSSWFNHEDTTKRKTLKG